MRKALAVVALVFGIIGLSAAVAQPASAIPIRVENKINMDPPNDEQYCARVNVTLFGNRIGTGPDYICIP